MAAAHSGLGFIVGAVGAFSLVACSGKTALEITPEPAPACSTVGWEHVAFTATPRQDGRLEVEVVDRLGVDAKLDRLMGPEDVRYLLATIGREVVTTGDAVPFRWSFGSRPPSAEPAPGACDDQRNEHSTLVSAWSSSQMCTREAARIGRSGSSSSLFEPSCFSDRGFRPTRLVRVGRTTAPAGEWVWLAAWVWAPQDAKVVMSSSGNSWSFTVDGAPAPVEGGPYPAWTLRARLIDATSP